MIKSMTGFASLTRDDERGTIGVAVRSVNHRFLDLQLRLPQTLVPMESRLRAVVQQGIARGRVEVSVTVQQRRTPALDVELNESFLDALGAALERARAEGHITGALTPGDLLRFPQALTIRERQEGAAPEDGLFDRVEEAVAAAVAELDTMRVREGGYLRADFDARRQKLGELFGKVHAASEAGIDGLRARLAERVRELRAEGLADEALVAQEIARFVGRSDITEEVVRFRGHLEHWRAAPRRPRPPPRSCRKRWGWLGRE